MRPDRWSRHPWQVVRGYHDGGVLYVCSHRTERRASWCATVQNLLAHNANGHYTTDVRLTLTH